MPAGPGARDGGRKLGTIQAVRPRPPAISYQSRITVSIRPCAMCVCDGRHPILN